MTRIDPLKDRLMFYGRRHGRRLRPAQAENLQRGLEKWQISEKLAAKAASLEPQSLFDGEVADVFLEIGFGGGEHLAARAEEMPAAGFIGAEPFINGVASLSKHILARGLQNIRIWPEDVRLLLPAFTPSSLAGVFILFPDPWPKKRHQDRRIVQPELLAELARLIRPGGTLLLASDEPTAKTWMLEHMSHCRDFDWLAQTAEDWRTPPSGWPGTRYMAKADRAGRASSWFEYRRNP